MEYSLINRGSKTLSQSNGLLREDLLQHITPLGWEHINFLGEYTFDLKRIPGQNLLLPLNAAQ